jgi:hypothetical protein
MQSISVATAVLLGLTLATASADDDQELSIKDCPAAVRKTFHAEANGAAIGTVTREKDDDGETIYWADVDLRGTTYAIGVLEDGTLTEMNVAVDDDDLALDRCPAAVQACFRTEAFGTKVESVGKDIKYGVTIYQTVVAHKGKTYQIVVAEDGTLVEKVLVIDDEEIELAKCPAAVQTALREHAGGGRIGEVTRYTGISGQTYETEVEIKGKVYSIEVDESGRLISKSLEAAKG